MIGGLVVSVWGLPKRRIHAVLSGCAASFLMGDLLFATGRTQPVWMLAGLVSAFFIPILVSGDRAIWQAKVPPDVQGRVFAVNGMIRSAMAPMGYVLGGLLADHVFEPALAAGGSLAGTFGWIVGTGPGAGMALMFFGTMVMGTTLCLGGYLIRAVRCVEDDLPDYDAAPENMPLPTELAAVGAD